MRWRRLLLLALTAAGLSAVEAEEKFASESDGGDALSNGVHGETEEIIAEETASTNGTSSPSAKLPGFPNLSVLPDMSWSIRPVGQPAIKMWTNRERQTAGLVGTYFDGKLSGRLEADLTSLDGGTSRIDEEINFEARNWGSRRKMGISGGERSRWKDFTVQWDGWIEFDRPGRLFLHTNGGNRMWVDSDGDGYFSDARSEFADNQWGSARRARSFSAMLPAGLHRVRLQYEGANKENWVELEATDGCVDYKSFLKDELRLFPWEGRNIVLLTRSADHDPLAIASIVGQFDDVFDYFVRVTGRKPKAHKTMNGKTTVAEVPNVGKALALGYVGSTGVEMRESAFGGYLKIHQNGGPPRSLMMWEFGRNFFFYSDQMRFRTPDKIGFKNTFAMIMRTTCFKDLNLPMQPFMEKVCQGQDKQLEIYEADDSLNFNNTLRVNADARGKRGKGPILLAAMIVRMHRDYGGEKFITRFWQSMARQPKAKTTQDAVDNIARAACIGAERNLTGLLSGPWKLPVSAEVKETMEKTYGAPDA